MTAPKRNNVVNILQEFSIPLLSGAVVAMLAANFAGAWYRDALHWMPFGHVSLIGHDLTLHFLVNDIFMVTTSSWSSSSGSRPRRSPKRACPVEA
jgi:hypothetical protein